MSYNFQFWQILKNPSSLTYLLEKEEERYKLKGYKKSVATVFFAVVLLYVLRDIWGMYTFRLTEVLGQGQVDEYIFARYLSVIGALITGILYFCFHYYVITYLLTLVTELPFKWIQKVQLYVITAILGFKIIEFIIFATAKMTTIYSPLSLSAIAAQFTSDLWTLYLINQLSLVTFCTIVIQYVFLAQWDTEARKSLLFKIVLIQILVAVFVAIISISPLIERFGKGLS